MGQVSEPDSLAAISRRFVYADWTTRLPHPETGMIRLTRPAVLSLLSLVGASPTPVSAEDEVRYNRDVRPILSNRCFKCHGPDLKKSGLDLQTRETALKPAKSGEPAIIPGKSADSHLLQRLTAEVNERMPPRGDPLT